VATDLNRFGHRAEALQFGSSKIQTKIVGGERWNGEGVKGSWNTAGSEATEDMPRKPLYAFAVTQSFRPQG
jgi:hypothetical protein